MKMSQLFKRSLYFSCLLTMSWSDSSIAEEKVPSVPRFSVENMDHSASPAVDFYQYANGTWQKNNPVPPDKAIWASFSELDARNEYLLHDLLEDARHDITAPPHSTKRMVGNFFASAMDTPAIEKLRLAPLKDDFAAIDRIKTLNDFFLFLADSHQYGLNALFMSDVQPDEKNSTTYAYQLWQGGLSLPDKDYYLKADFKRERDAYTQHVTKMFELAGETPASATQIANTVLAIETELATASRTRVELRDPNKNYNKISTVELINQYPQLPWQNYLQARGLGNVNYVILGQPEFFTAIEKLTSKHSIADLKNYLRWQLIHSAAPFLSQDFDTENFNFFGRILKGQQEQEARWKRANRVLDGAIGEALGKLYVEKYFTPEAKARMTALVKNLTTVFRDHLQQVEWMSEQTRAKALAKFDRFTHKIGFPDKFRDYSELTISANDYFGNVKRATIFEVKRRLARVGQPVDRTEWEMTPPTVNAYFNPPLNEIVFPAGILQPPFFDVAMDDPVNYGAIGVVIGHEMTHGYDDQGRNYDADGNLNDWWTAKDADEFKQRAQKIVDEYNEFQILPGVHVNGELTLGENIADLGGVSIAYDAMQRALQKDPSKRKIIDGLTPEQRFFISYAQVWRTAVKDEEAKRRVTVDPHAPGRFRAFGPLLNYQEFYDAFGIGPGAPMWRAPALRVKIW